MAWTARTTAPDVSIKYYRHTGYYVGGVDGVNECLIIDSNTGFVMPNCVGYSWGRWYEAFDTRPTLSRGDAWLWYGNTADGYQRGSVPRVGAIACWYDRNHPTSGGHVAVVEYFVGGLPVTSNSAYNSTLFFMEALVFNSQTGEWERGYNPQQYGWQGFIYPPEGVSLDKFYLWLAGQRRFPNGRARIPNNRRF